jgi:hypothetical protein
MGVIWAGSNWTGRNRCWWLARSGVSWPVMLMVVVGSVMVFMPGILDDGW